MKTTPDRDHKDRAHEGKDEKPAAISFEEMLARAEKAKPDTGGEKKFDPEKEGVEFPGDNDKVVEA